ncbi:MAG: alpha/beta fold hydrolase [Oscillospiraceae bacterium]|nr:alpha/beta fold hydrolase [Oscillospiraceae bacterium]
MKRNDVIKGNEISELYTFTLGGFPQKVLIEGKSRNLPIVITLHGGPGTPIPFSVGCRGLFPAFTNKFIMVYWDQLGCGINNHPIDGSFTIAAFVNMTADLIREVKQLFPENRIFLFSTSWGSILSALVMEQEPVDGVAACGQIVRNVFFNDIVYHELEQSKLPKEKLAKIRSIRIEQITNKDMMLVSGSVRKYTYGNVNPNGKKAPMGSMIWGLLTSPDYRFRDFKAIMMNGCQGNLTLWKEILTLDLTDTLRNVKIPYLMVQGDTDIVATTEYVQEIVENSGNPRLQCRVVKNCGHEPTADMMDAVFHALDELTKE